MDSATPVQNCLNISLLLGHSTTAIHCQSEEDAIAFVSAAIEQLHEACGVWRKDNIHWVEYKENTAYSIEMEDSGKYRMYFGDVPWYTEHGYDIVSFADFAKGKLTSPDIPESELPIDALFGA